MSLRFLAITVALASTFALSGGQAFAAEEDPDTVEPPDAARFRGGVSAGGGAIVVPDAVNLGLAGVQGQLGVQINHLVGLYAVPEFDVVFGEMGGVHFAGALLVDFSIIDEISIGVGPEAAMFAAIGSNDGTGVAAAGGALYGARLHLGFQPVWGRGDNGVRRQALTIGVDMRFLAGEAGFAAVSATTAEAAERPFVLSPMLTIGYQAF
jgi:hypothetical protein